jgi:excinuclease UvrABC ATPase subunit
VIKTADRIIDLGPGGAELLAEGTPGQRSMIALISRS